MEHSAKINPVLASVSSYPSSDTSLKNINASCLLPLTSTTTLTCSSFSSSQSKITTVPLGKTITFYPRIVVAGQPAENSVPQTSFVTLSYGISVCPTAFSSHTTIAPAHLGLRSCNTTSTLSNYDLATSGITCDLSTGLFNQRVAPSKPSSATTLVTSHSRLNRDAHALALTSVSSNVTSNLLTHLEIPARGVRPRGDCQSQLSESASFVRGANSTSMKLVALTNSASTILSDALASPHTFHARQHHAQPEQPILAGTGMPTSRKLFELERKVHHPSDRIPSTSTATLTTSTVSTSTQLLSLVQNSELHNQAQKVSTTVRVMPQIASFPQTMAKPTNTSHHPTTNSSTGLTTIYTKQHLPAGVGLGLNSGPTGSVAGSCVKSVDSACPPQTGLVSSPVQVEASVGPRLAHQPVIRAFTLTAGVATSLGSSLCLQARGPSSSLPLHTALTPNRKRCRKQQLLSTMMANQQASPSQQQHPLLASTPLTIRVGAGDKPAERALPLWPGNALKGGCITPPLQAGSSPISPEPTKVLQGCLPRGATGLVGIRLLSMPPKQNAAPLSDAAGCAVPASLAPRPAPLSPASTGVVRVGETAALRQAFLAPPLLVPGGILQVRFKATPTTTESPSTALHGLSTPQPADLHQVTSPTTLHSKLISPFDSTALSADSVAAKVGVGRPPEECSLQPALGAGAGVLPPESIRLLEDRPLPSKRPRKQAGSCPKTQPAISSSCQALDYSPKTSRLVLSSDNLDWVIRGCPPSRKLLFRPLIPSYRPGSSWKGPKNSHFLRPSDVRDRSESQSVYKCPSSSVGVRRRGFRTLRAPAENVTSELSLFACLLKIRGLHYDTRLINHPPHTTTTLDITGWRLLWCLQNLSHMRSVEMEGLNRVEMIANLVRRAYVTFPSSPDQPAGMDSIPVASISDRQLPYRMLNSPMGGRTPEKAIALSNCGPDLALPSSSLEVSRSLQDRRINENRPSHKFKFEDVQDLTLGLGQRKSLLLDSVNRIHCLSRGIVENHGPVLYNLLLQLEALGADTAALPLDESVPPSTNHTCSRVMTTTIQRD